MDEEELFNRELASRSETQRRENGSSSSSTSANELAGRAAVEAIYDSFKIEDVMNRDDNSLPYGYYHPEYDGKVVWICDRDQDGNIVSVISQDHGTHKDKQPILVESAEKALLYRNMLIDAGWKKIKPPEICVKRPDGEKKPLNRSEKRFLKRKIKKITNRTNPFINVTD